ncbi:Xyloglucan endo-transglycosylase, C-terminal [Dillenia turbinata]|uniref:xyloglucan:xyloglucosyl transferase n=1 Tax=Dillenia turbinata TaxID=194707 RepID=A0AAN8UWA0_9MAGN
MSEFFSRQDLRLWFPKYLFGRIDMQIKLMSLCMFMSAAPFHKNDLVDNNLQRFHVLTVLWHYSFPVADTPIREFKNMEAIGVLFPNKQAMRIYSSLWNADDWATMGGRVKIDWTKGPFIASYSNFNADACIRSSVSPNCASVVTSTTSDGGWQTQELDSASRKWLECVQRHYMIYNYCTDFKRFPQGLPPECRHQ